MEHVVVITDLNTILSASHYLSFDSTTEEQQNWGQLCPGYSAAAHLGHREQMQQDFLLVKQVFERRGKPMDCSYLNFNCPIL